jgi:II/X family phage/plasmid replication protein
MVMIDWITAKIPFNFEEPINGGKVVNIDSNGVLTATKDRWFPVVGSNESKVQVLTSIDKTLGMSLHVSGNPSKFLQGHNLFGSGDLVGLCGVFFCELADRLKHKISDSEYYDWTQGNYSLSRVDVNGMFSRGSRSAVRELCDNIAAPKLDLRRVGGGVNDCCTVYVKERSRRRRNPEARRQAPRWEGRIYGKADELRLKNIPRNADEWEALKDKSWGGNLPEDLLFRDDLCTWADDKVRVERQLNRKFLDEHDLNHGYNWRIPNQPPDYQARILLEDLLLKIRYFNGSSIDVDLVATLPKKLLAPLQLWRDGNDLRQLFPDSTFKRFRRLFLELLDLDILEPVKNEGGRSISASEPWSLVPEPIPAFALGTSLVAKVAVSPMTAAEMAVLPYLRGIVVVIGLLFGYMKFKDWFYGTDLQYFSYKAFGDQDFVAKKFDFIGKIWLTLEREKLLNQTFFWISLERKKLEVRENLLHKKYKASRFLDVAKNATKRTVTHILPMRSQFNNKKPASIKKPKAP